MECECINACPFFNDRMANMPAMADIYKNRYCKGNFNECARYMVFKALGKPAVPSDLFPNQKEKALKLIEEKRKN